MASCEDVEDIDVERFGWMKIGSEDGEIAKLLPELYPFEFSAGEDKFTDMVSTSDFL